MGECSKCGRCCTGFVIKMQKPLPHDILFYMKLHGVKEIDHRHLWVPLRCGFLSPSGLCEVHDKIRPGACKIYPTSNDWTPDGCTAREVTE